MVVTDRLDVRLDPERRRKLIQLVTARGRSVSDVVREAIDLAYEEAQREQRRRAARELTAMAVEEPPDPQTLCRELGGAYGGDLP